MDKFSWCKREGIVIKVADFVIAVSFTLLRTWLCAGSRPHVRLVGHVYVPGEPTPVIARLTG